MRACRGRPNGARDVAESRDPALRRLPFADDLPVPAFMIRPIPHPSSRRGRQGSLLVVVLFLLLQCLQPLLHAHPEPSSHTPQGAAHVASVHLPDAPALWRAADREGSAPVTVSAEDDLRRASPCAVALVAAAHRCVIPAPSVLLRVRPPEGHTRVPDPGAFPGPARGPPFSEV